jgi:hypothetical protein
LPDTNEKSLPTLATELWELVLTYLKQETVDPIKKLGRFVAFGFAGGFVLALGLVLVVLAGLRALQVETGDHFGGSLSWAPYLIVFAATIVFAALGARAIGSKKRKAQKKGTMV